MPIHDWTRVDHGTFHDFHQGWVTAIRSALNNGLLPPDYEARIEPHAVPPTPEFELDLHVRLWKTVVVRNSDARAVAFIQIVTPGSKASELAVRSMARKVTGALREGVNVLVVDLFPPGEFDPNGIHGAIWSAIGYSRYLALDDKRLTIASYVGDSELRAYVDPVAVGETLPEMPLFLEPESYISLPLEATYAAAFEGIPRRTRERLNAAG
jgi:hypothetical protein